jgi:hypothetical protein
MSDREPWARQEGESLTWYNRFTAFRLMVPVHSIPDVFREEDRKKAEKEAAENGGKLREIRTEAPSHWYQEAKKWRWEERAAAWDAYQDALIEKQIAAEEKHVIRTHYALKHKRIAELDAIVSRLIGYLDDEANVWLPDVKAIGVGPVAERVIERVDIIRFNEAIFAQIRGYLADIAAEKGERVKNSKMAISFPPDVYEGIGPDDDGSEV